MGIFKHFFAVLGIIFAVQCLSQTNEVFIPINVQKAIAKKTRSNDGMPGMLYWQNRADYKIDVSFDPKTLLISGTEKITYTNNSPDTLKHLIFHLFPNMFKKGNMRDTDIEPADESEGVSIDKVSINGFELNEQEMLELLYIEHTLLRLKLKKKLLPDRQIGIDIKWHYTLNRNSHIRTGAVDSASFFVAYFFPRIAVYDDVDGWNYYKYTNEQEFYNDFGNFDVSITMPKNYIVWATGTLQNPEEVLSEKYIGRYKAVSMSNVVMKIIDLDDLKKNDFTTQKDFNTWRFKATNVSDFAFGTSNHYLWESTSVIVDKKTGRKTILDVAYNKDSKDFYKVVNYGRQAIELMSFNFPAYPFPFPNITVFNGLSEMEYPMIVNNRSYEDIHSTIDLTAHEIFHSYFPFYCGFNETRHAWLDEGLTTLSTFFFTSEMDPNFAKLCFVEEYQTDMGTMLDLPLFSNSNSIRNPVYEYLSYPKAALFFLNLKDLVGDDLFKKSLHEFMNQWTGKHPLPMDLLNTFSTVSGKDISWFIKPWVYEFGYVDLGIKEVTEKNDKYLINIDRLGHFPSLINLKISYQDGTIEIVHQTPEVWKNGTSNVIIEKNLYRKIKKLELLDEHGLDVNPSNNTYTVNAWRLNNR